MARTEFPNTPEELTGEWVKNLRLDAGLTPAQLNDLCNFTTSTTITRIEKKNDFRSPGERKIIIKKLQELWDKRQGRHNNDQSNSPTVLKGRQKGETGDERAARLDAALRANGVHISEDIDESNQFVHNSTNNEFDLSNVEVTLSTDEIEENYAYPSDETIEEIKATFDSGIKELTSPRDGIKLISNSEISTWQRCRRKWWLQWYRELTSNYRDYLSPLDTGNRVHRALAAYYVPDGQTPTDPRDALERAIVDDWTQIAAQTNDEQQLEELSVKFNDAVGLERAMIEGYIEWITDSGEDSNYKVIASETAITADLTVDMGYKPSIREHDMRPVKAIALLDARIVRVSDNVRLFMDHKTVQNFAMPRKTLHLNPQMLHYHLLEYLNTEQGQERCDGALYNMLRKVKRTRAANPPFFDRVPVTHNQYQIDAYKTRLLSATRDILTAQDQLDAGANPLTIAYPNPGENCSYDCPFFSICNLFDDGSRVDDAIVGLYHTENPLKRYDGFIENGE